MLIELRALDKQIQSGLIHARAVFVLMRCWDICHHVALCRDERSCITEFKPRALRCDTGSRSWNRSQHLTQKGFSPWAPHVGKKENKAAGKSQLCSWAKWAAVIAIRGYRTVLEHLYPDLAICHQSCFNLSFIFFPPQVILAFLYVLPHFLCTDKHYCWPFSKA